MIINEHSVQLEARPPFVDDMTEEIREKVTYLLSFHPQLAGEVTAYDRRQSHSIFQLQSIHLSSLITSSMKLRGDESHRGNVRHVDYGASVAN